VTRVQFIIAVEMFSSPAQPDQPWGPTQIPVQHISEAIFSEVKRPRSWMCRFIPPLPHSFSWYGTYPHRYLYLLLTL